MPSRTRAGLFCDECARCKMSLHALVPAGKKRAHSKMLRFARVMIVVGWEHPVVRRPVVRRSAPLLTVEEWALPALLLEKWMRCFRLHYLNQS